MGPRAGCWIGLMSGTSLDGVDGVLVRFGDASTGTGTGTSASASASGDGDSDSDIKVLAHAHRAFDGALVAELLALNTSSNDELHRAALGANALVRVCAEVVADLLAITGMSAAEVSAIGAHGQTVRHRPREFDGIGYTLQINNPALLAELTGIDVVADFRSRDVAAGGQGAPLVPAFHRYAFGQAGEAVAVLNLGGIANISVIAQTGATLGFDCGPANALMDAWCLRHRGTAFDADGAWAATGQVVPALLVRMKAEPYFALPTPKSTGRDLFNDVWLRSMLPSTGHALAPEDVQATLAELTAWSAADAVGTHAAGAPRVIACGGGARNGHLMRRLAALTGKPIVASSELGLEVDQVEAAAFAWLAKACVERHPGNLVAVTGAAGPRVLGAVWPAG